MSYKFNGTTIEFDEGGLAPLLSIEYDEKAEKIPITGSASTAHAYEAGIPQRRVTVEIVGGTTIVVGDLGAIAPVWNHGSSTVGALANAVCTGVERGGQLDGRTTSKLSFAEAA